MPVHICLAVDIKLKSSLRVSCLVEDLLKYVHLKPILCSLVLICLGVSMFVSALVHRVCATTW